MELHQAKKAFQVEDKFSVRETDRPPMVRSSASLRSCAVLTLALGNFVRVSRLPSIRSLNNWCNLLLAGGKMDSACCLVIVHVGCRDDVDGCWNFFKGFSKVRVLSRVPTGADATDSFLLGGE